jgi:hypothetical protein
VAPSPDSQPKSEPETVRRIDTDRAALYLQIRDAALQNPNQAGEFPANLCKLRFPGIGALDSRSSHNLRLRQLGFSVTCLTTPAKPDVIMARW